MTPNSSRDSRRIWFAATKGMAIVVFAFLIFPNLVIVPLSFNRGEFLHYPLQGLSLRWYADFFFGGRWLPAIQNSAVVAVGATLSATVLGTLAAIGLDHSSFRGKSLVVAFLLSPLMVPLVVTGLGLYLFYARLGLNDTYVGMIIAHTILGSPFVLITVSASLQGFDKGLVRAAQSLGASRIRVFRKIVAPLIAPGIVSGAMFAFATSLDEVIIVLFITGPRHRTLPLQMFSGTRELLSPTILAAAVMLIAFAVLLIITLGLMERRARRLIGTPER